MSDLPPSMQSFLIPSIPSEQTLNRLPSLPRLTALERGPLLDGAGLDAHHGLVAVVGAKVAHGGGLFLPRVPDDRVGQVVADDVVAGLAVDDHRRRALRDGAVDAVRLAGDGQVGLGLRVRAGVEHLVRVRDAEEAGDAGLGDVLHCCKKELQSVFHDFILGIKLKPSGMLNEGEEGESH